MALSADRQFKLKLYVQLWNKATPEMHLAASNSFWTSSACTTAAIRQVLRARYGVMWHMRRAYNLRMPYFPGAPIARHFKCPLCHLDDSTAHMVNGCQHPEMKALQIERHNAAGRLILKEMAQGKHGSNYIMADLGCYNKMEEMLVHDNRLSASILSDATLEQHGLSPATRPKFRPDIMTIEASSERVLSGRLARKRKFNGAKCRPGSRVKIVEVGYTSETRYHEKLQEKEMQHEQLIAMLK